MTDRRYRLILQGWNEQKQSKIERRSRNRQPHTTASSFRLCGFHRKNHKETIPAHKIWISSIAQSMCCRPSSLPSEPVLAFGA